MKRFYREVTVAQDEPGWRVLLDGRGIKTAGGRAQVVPTRALAEALAEEWSQQGEELDQDAFTLRHLADFAIDIVAPCRDEAVRMLLPFAETDTLCYRAEPGEALHRRQLEVWEPLLAEAEARWDVHFTRIGGIIHQHQPPETLARMHAALMTYCDFTLAALNQLANLSASLIVALAALDTKAEPEALWAAANLEEDWQTSLWGEDAEAAARRDRRFAEFAAALRFGALARDGTEKP